MNWRFFSSSVTGTSHYSTSTPCQDKHSVVTSPNGKWLIAVASDGAGSAKFAEIGAETTVKKFSDSLTSLASVLDERPPGAWINDYIIENILELRQYLRKIACKDEINDYHCTLVAALLGENGGFSIHIGDGHIAGGNYGILKDGKIDLNINKFDSLPENGEYANETYFITDGNWIKHIRVSPLPALDWIILSTDGGSSLLFDNKNNIKPGFLIPILSFSLDDHSNASKLLTSTISSPETNHLTSDDKTIVIAYKQNSILQSEKIIFLDKSPVDQNSIPKHSSNTITNTQNQSNNTYPSASKKLLAKKPNSNEIKSKSLAKLVLVLVSLLTVLIIIYSLKEWGHLSGYHFSEEIFKSNQIAKDKSPSNQPANSELNNDESKQESAQNDISTANNNNINETSDAKSKKSSNSSDK